MKFSPEIQNNNRFSPIQNTYCFQYNMGIMSFSNCLLDNNYILITNCSGAFVSPERFISLSKGLKPPPLLSSIIDV